MNLIFPFTFSQSVTILNCDFEYLYYIFLEVLQNLV